MLCEEVYELGFLRVEGKVDVVFEEEAAELGDAEGGGVEVWGEVGGGVIVHFAVVWGVGL